MSWETVRDHLTTILLDDDSSVRAQIRRGLVHHRTFLLLNEASRFNDTSSRNPLICKFIRDSWLYSQVILIRSAAFDKQSDACSILRAISFLRQNKDHVTRQAYVTFGNVPYDFQRARNEYLDKRASDEIEDGEPIAWLMSSEGQGWVRSEQRHRKFDTISRTTPDSRHASDKLSCDWLNCVEERLEPLNDTLRTFANKFIAHSIRTDVTARLQSEAQSTSIAQIESAWGIIMNTNQELCGTLLQHSYTLQMRCCVEDLALLDCPIVPGGHIAELKRYYKDQNKRLVHLGKKSS